MKKILCVLFIPLMLLLSSCGSKEAAPKTPPENKEQINVSLEPSVEKIADNKYKISVKSNLPDGYELMLTLSNAEKYIAEKGLPSETPEKWTDSQFRDVQQNTYRGQGKAKLKSGIVDVTFSGDKLLPGEYDLEISGALVRLQDASLKTLIGEKGEKLTGPNVHLDTVVTGDNYVVSCKTKVNL